MVNLTKSKPNKSTSDEHVSQMIEEALRDQRSDFSVQIRGLFNIIMILNKQIETLEKRVTSKEGGDRVKELPTAKHGATTKAPLRSTTAAATTKTQPKKIESNSRLATRNATGSQRSKSSSFTSASFSSGWK